MICLCDNDPVKIRLVELPRLTRDTVMGRFWGLCKYRGPILVPDDAEIVSLSEGRTPHEVKKGHTMHVYLKFEGTNPISPFK